MRTITLEILRHGPPHNQLLSPLTQYLALCENHAAVTINVPYEHAQFLHRLRALSYELQDEATRRFQLDDTGRELGQLLARIPSLIAELTQSGQGTNGDLLHMRMIVSASELALLPFELAISANGFPGEGRSFLLQSTLPICLTREVRQASGANPSWTRTPKILFAAASPADVGPIPLESHLLALRGAIDPWVHHFENAEERRRKIEEHLVVLPHATVEQIREQCATGTFTHVHILAHGLATTPRNRLDYHYGLALNDSRDPAQKSVVDGRTLARVLRTDCADGSGPAQPLVVTLASCNSGDVGSVVNFAGAGASIAHAIHAEGVPLVVASQFPLSFRGSVQMVETIYPGLLNGEDPRELLHDLRGRLHALIPETHDWASVVAYAALDSRFERQLERFQVDQAHRRANTALNHADKLIFLGPEPEEDEESSNKVLTGKEVLEALERVEEAKRRLRELRAKAAQNVADRSGLHETTEGRDRRDRAETHLAYISGLIAAAEKRHAELILGPRVESGTSTPLQLRESRELLENSLDAYWDAAFYDRSNVWALVQHIYLQCILKRLGSKREKALPAERRRHPLWEHALNASLTDTRSEDAERDLWARANLLELRILQLELKHSRASVRMRDNKETGDRDEHIARILTLTAGKDDARYSIRRQIRRYAAPRNKFSPAAAKEARELSRRLRTS